MAHNNPLDDNSNLPSREEEDIEGDMLEHQDQQGEGQDAPVGVLGRMATFQQEFYHQYQKDRELQQKREEEALERQRQRDVAVMNKLNAISAGNGTTVEKRVLAPLPAIWLVDDLEAWNMQLHSSLMRYGLEKYIKSDVPPPDQNDVSAYQTWQDDRADVYYLITASLKKSDVWLKMRNIGWKWDVIDPFATYKKVLEVFQHGLIHSGNLILEEYEQLRAHKFDSMDSFLNKLTSLKSRLGVFNMKANEVWHM
ncbi:hypothetical protein VTH82DRAFT_8185 [Thermothelomyces myriococcoides]